MSVDQLHLPLRELTPEVVSDLQEKYPEAEISVTLRQGESSKRMSEEDFWNVISLLDWSKSDDDAIIEPAIAKLSAMPVFSIYQFADLLSEKLYALDTRAHAENIGEGAWKEGAPFSADEFLYVRCCVVANGREYYEAVLKDPSQMPRNEDFEPLLQIAAEAYLLKTGKEFAYIPAQNFESFSNKEAWS